MAIVTVSRQMGTGGRLIARGIAEAANYAYVDKENILADLRQAGGPWASWEKEMDEVCPTLWERFDRSFAGLVALVEKSVLEAALQNNVVIVGRGANFILRGVLHAFHLQVVGPVNFRTEWVMSHYDIPYDAAATLVKKIDHDRACYLRTVYHGDWNDSREYNAVFDVGIQSGEKIIASVVSLLPEKDRAFSEANRTKLRQRTLAAQVKAAILIEPQLFIPALEVSHDGTELMVSGIIHKLKHYKRIEEIVHQIAPGEIVNVSKLHLPD